MTFNLIQITFETMFDVRFNMFDKFLNVSR